MASSAARVSHGAHIDFTGNCAFKKCELPLAERVYRTACDHYFHASCLKGCYDLDPLCPICKNDLSKTDVITFEPVEYEGEDDCTICLQSMKQTAQRLQQDIIVTSNGHCFHAGCFKGPDANIQTRIAAKDVVEDPTFKMWEEGGKRRLDNPGEAVPGDDELAKKLEQQELLRLQNGGAAAAAAAAAGVQGAGYPALDNDFQMLIVGIVIALCLLSAVAFVLNSFVNFSDPLLHLASIPFYLIVVAAICKSAYDNCIAAP